MVTRPVWWDVRFIVTLWTPFSSFIHSFNQISWVRFVGRRFSFITIASIDFWSDLELISLHFNACILPRIIRHTVVYAVWYGVWFLMVWPWFGHSSLNHNEYAVSSAVSRMKMPPVREHASSLISLHDKYRSILLDLIFRELRELKKTKLLYSWMLLL